jgi:uncharacterized protein (DUF2336 family)
VTPKRLLRRLIAERGEIASKVLAHAALDSQTLNAAAVLGTSEMALAVAQRDNIDASVARGLAERPEIDVLCALVDNPTAPVDASLHRYLVRRARDNEELAAKLIKRGGDPADSSALFLSASREQRIEIIAAIRRHDLGIAVRADPVQGAAEALAQIERAVLLPGRDGLDTALGIALGLSTSDADRLIDDRGGEPLAIALAALGASPELAARIFILRDPAIGHSYPRVKALVGIVETVSPRAARRLVAAMTGTPAPIARRQTSLQTVAGRHQTGPASRAGQTNDAGASTPLTKRAG